MANCSASFPYLILVIFALCFAIAGSDHDITTSDESAGSNNGDDVCAGFTSQAKSCPINCFRADPVCGVDGITYWCGCVDAMCHGTRVAKLGSCEVGSSSSTPVPGQALLLIHLLWLILLGFCLLLDLF